MPSKRFKKLPKDSKMLDPNVFEKLIPAVKKNCTVKFDESIDLNLQINNKQKKGEVNIRTVVNMPSGTGKKIIVAVLCDETLKASAKKAGADIVGGDDLIEKIKAEEINFEKLICTPKMMISLSKLGKILGPKGLMPNPKVGTVTNNIKSTVNSLKTGQIEIKNDQDGNIAASIGKKSFSDVKIKENFDVFLNTILKEKPSGIKGDFIISAFLTSTMGISYKLNLKKSRL